MDDCDSPYIGLIVLLLFLILHIVLYGFMSAISNLNESSLEKQAKEGDKKASLLLLLGKKPTGSVHNLQFFVTGMHLAAGAYVISRFPPVARILALSIYWLLILAFGMYAPMKIADKKSEKWGRGLCRLVSLFTLAGFPFVKCMEFTADCFVRLFGIDPKADPEDLTEEEIMSMVNEGHEQGVLLASEAEMIHNIFEFGDKEAKDIMTHRKNIKSLEGEMTFAKAMDFMTESGNSRFPVYTGDIDNIIGVLHIKEALQISTDQNCYDRPIQEIPNLVRKVDFIPETRNIHLLFKEMQAKKSHMVIVVDEYGQTSGIVAMEDILEEIVGNILDEHDDYEEMILKQTNGSYVMNGMADFEDVAKALELEGAEEEDAYETLNGFLISKIDKIPEEDDRIEVISHGYCFKILAVENKIIQKVLVTRKEDSPCQNPERMVK